MTEPANVTTDSGTPADGDGAQPVPAGQDPTTAVTENGAVYGGGDADLQPDH